MKKAASICVLSALFVAMSGCNSSSGGNGSGSGISETKPENRTSPRSSMSLDPTNDTGELSQMFAGGLNGQLPGGTGANDFSMLSGTIEARRSQPTNNAEVFLTELMTQIELVNDRRMRTLSARNDGEIDPGDMFEEICTTGSASYSQSDDAVSLSFNNCIMDMDEHGEMRISGSFSVSASGGGLDEAVDDALVGDVCLEDSVSASMIADDFWFRTYDGSGNRTESAFLSADITFTVGCENDITTATVEGPHFFMDVNDEWFGFYNFDFTAGFDESGTPDEYFTSIDFVFDSSELTGSLEVATPDQFRIRENDDYPYTGTMILKAGNDELEYSFADFTNEDDTDAVTIAGRSGGDPACSGQSSWAQMNNGQASCNP